MKPRYFYTGTQPNYIDTRRMVRLPDHEELQHDKNQGYQ